MTRVARDLAAPLELAVAAAHHVHHLLPGVHATAVAEVGALPDLLGLVGGGGVHLAGPAVHALVAQLRVEGAVVRAGLQEHQLPLLDLVLGVGLHLLGCPPASGHQVVAAGLQHVVDAVHLHHIAPLLLSSLQLRLQDTVAVVHLGCLLVLLLQIVSHLVEVPQLSPAGLSGAAPAHPVTLAQCSHGLPHRDPPSLVVVKVGQAHRLLVLPVHVEELLADLFSEHQVVTASSPLPVVSSTAPVQSLTPALGQVTLAAVPADGVGHPGADDGVDVGSLPVVLQSVLVHVEGGDGAVPDVVFELSGALLHGQLCSTGDAGAEQQICFIDVSAGQHCIGE